MRQLFCSCRSPDNLGHNPLQNEAMQEMQEMQESQILIEFPESIVFPDGFNSLGEYAVYVREQAAQSRTGTHTQRLSDTAIIEYIAVLPSLILTCEDGQDWPELSVLQWGDAFFGGRDFREIQLQTAGGYKSMRGMVEITPNFSDLKNFRVTE